MSTPKPPCPDDELAASRGQGVAELLLPGGRRTRDHDEFLGFVRFAYLDNPLPSLFKERLFVYLSRSCIVRYCIA